MTYDRAVLVDVLVHHQRSGISPCPCGRARLGESHPEHVADEYEQAMRAQS